MNYEQANNQLNGRNKVSRKLANNTYLIRLSDNSIAAKLHQTNIITFCSDGKIVLNSGGWFTPTTKNRINSYSGYRISQSNSRWSLSVNGVWYPFADGITIQNDKVSNAGKENLKADVKFKSIVKAYAQLCANSIPLDKPSAGDCWYCAMVTTDDKTLGDQFKDTDHLKSHMSDKYVVPSLVYHAMIESGYNPQRNIQFSLVFDNPHGMIDIAQNCVKKSVYKYILQRFCYAK